jgi:hypothetical protein
MNEHLGKYVEARMTGCVGLQISFEVWLFGI